MSDTNEPSKVELYELAQEADIEGRSTMTKQELVDALEQDEPTPARSARKGVYVLQRNDHPGSVAHQLYGRQSRGRDLVLANPDVDWVEGAEIKVPN